jgi:demethylmenaquinone methyltransferase/2-methoxy-6-polyprenyl-1,4-benzoquinol methylase
VSTRHDYTRQARTYDTTRAASPSVLGPLLEALEGAGPNLLDVGGGTGNYAAALRRHGFQPTVFDLNEAMLEHARLKDLPTVVGDATALPFADDTWDAVTLISMLHHVPDWRAALEEAKRVLVSGGRLVLKGWSREHVEQVTWVNDYFPSAKAWMLEHHPPFADALEVLPGARMVPIEFTDTIDGSMAALQRFPELLLDPANYRQTSYFERLADNVPDELAAGLARLKADLEAGVDPNAKVAEARAQLGDVCLVVWVKPG